MARKLDRRTFIGAASGAAGATALGPWGSVSLGHGRGNQKDKRLVPRDRLGLQQWAVRDCITRLNQSASGYLGGPGFPENPANLGPLTPLPGGFAAVFQYLASVGYRGFEFFSFDQGANGAITDQQIRAALDSAGLVASGTHTGGCSRWSTPPTDRRRSPEPGSSAAG